MNARTVKERLVVSVAGGALLLHDGKLQWTYMAGGRYVRPSALTVLGSAQWWASKNANMESGKIEPSDITFGPKHSEWLSMIVRALEGQK